MAKKKKKVAKKAAKKKASGAAAAQEGGFCSDQKLETAGVVDAGGELLLQLGTAIAGALQDQGIDVPRLINSVLARLQPRQPIARVNGEENAEARLDLARELFLVHDSNGKPYLRVFGRVMEILLNNRGFQTCTAGDVFRVFLVEIPDEIPEHYRQTPPSGQQVSVSTGEGRKTFNNRMKKMRRLGMAAPTVSRDSGRNEDYVLTDRGQLLFNNWPPLTEIPGLELDGSVTPESLAISRSRRRSRRRS